MPDIHAFEPLWGVWKIEKLLGKGSYGSVYLGRREDAGRVQYAAIKHIPIPRDDQELQDAREQGLLGSGPEASVSYCNRKKEAVLREVDVCYRLKGNSNLVSYEDHMVIPRKDCGYDVFIRMEKLMGLNEYLSKRGGLHKEDIFRLGIDMCRALEVLEREKMLHRDIKPSNILVNEWGSFKLGDFGVARSLDATMSGITVAGTLNYMAPEIQRGDAVDRTADIYSLGLVLYRLCNRNRAPFLPVNTAEVSFEATQEAQARRLRGEPLPPPAYVQELSGVILKACAFRPGDRYQSAAEFRRAIEQVQSGEKDGGPVSGGTGNRGAGGTDAGGTGGSGTWGTGGRSDGSSVRWRRTEESGSQPPPPPPPPVRTRRRGGSLVPWAILAGVLLVCGLTALALTLSSGSDSPGKVTAPAGTEPPAAAVTPGESHTTPAPDSVEGLLDPVETEQSTEDLSRMAPEDLDIFLSYAPGVDAQSAVVDASRQYLYGSSASGESWSISALTFVPVLYALTCEIQSGNMEMSTQVPYQYVSGRGGSQSLYDDEEYVSVETMAAYTLAYSDNAALTTLLYAIGTDKVNEWCHQAGYVSVEVYAAVGGGGNNYASAQDLALMLWAMWDNPGTGINRSFLREYMGSQIDANWSLPADATSARRLNALRDDLYNEAGIYTLEDGTEFVMITLAQAGNSADRQDLVRHMEREVSAALCDES